MMAEHILRLLAGLFVGVYVARYLGPAQFGIFNYVLTLVALFGTVAKLGLDGIVVRELVNHPEQRLRLIGTAFWLKVAGGIAAFAVIAGILPWMNNDTTTNLYVLVVAAGLAFDAFDVFDFHFQSIVQSKYSSICKATQLAVSSLLKIALVLAQADLGWFVIATLVDKITLAGAYAFIARQKQLLPGLRCLVPELANGLLRASWPLILSGLAVMVYMRIDLVMIKEMIGDEAAGIYSAAAKLSEVWYFVPTVLCTSMFPAILAAKMRSQELYIERLRKLYAFLVVLALSIAVVVAFLAESVVLLLYGGKFHAAAAVLKFHIWAGLFVAIGVVNSKWFVAEGKFTVAARNTAIGAVANVVLNYILIPKYGPSGAAMATLFSYGMVAYVLLLADRSTRKMFFLISRSMLPRAVSKSAI